MSPAARSVLIFGVYLVLLGAGLMLVPNFVLAPFGFPPIGDVWLRVGGSLVVIIGGFFLVAARHELTAFFRATLFARPFLFLSLCAYVLAGLAPPQLILFGVIDLAGALWTLVALRKV